MAEELTQLQGLPLGPQIRVQRLTATWDLTISGLLGPWLDVGEVGTQLSGLTKLDISVAERWKPAARQWDRNQTPRDGGGSGGGEETKMEGFQRCWRAQGFSIGPMGLTGK